MTNKTLENFLSDNKNKQLVVIFKLEDGLKTFTFYNINSFIKTALLIINNSIRAPTLFIKTKIKKYTNEECLLIYKYIYNIYILRYNLDKLRYNLFIKNKRKSNKFLSLVNRDY